MDYYNIDWDTVKGDPKKIFHKIAKQYRDKNAIKNKKIMSTKQYKKLSKQVQEGKKTEEDLWKYLRERGFADL